VTLARPRTSDTTKADGREDHEGTSRPLGIDESTHRADHAGVRSSAAAACSVTRPFFVLVVLFVVQPEARRLSTRLRRTRRRRTLR